MPRAPFARIFSFRAKMHFLHLCLDHLDTHAFLDPKRSIRRGESEICRSSRSDRQNKVRASANNISPPKFLGLVGHSWFRSDRRRRRARRIGSCASLSGAVPDTDAHLTPPFHHGYVPRAVLAARAIRECELSTTIACAARSRMRIVDDDRRCLPSRSARNFARDALASRPPLKPRTDLNASRS